MLYGQGGGLVLDYIRQPYKGQVFLCYFGQETGVNFPHCDLKQRIVRKRITKSMLKHFCLKLTMFRNSIPVMCHQPDLGNVYD